MAAERRWSAPAKINLYLHVVGRRADGFHVLDSLVAFADIADEIVAAPAAQLSLRLEGPFAASLAGPLENNLVWRAAVAFAAALGRAPGAALTLVKNLPVASGIGGGSSDAAAALKALSALWQSELAPAAMATIAAALGADVTVCLAQRASWLGGTGDIVVSAPGLPPAWVVLANPGVALPTAAVFRRRAGPYGAPARFAMPRDAAALASLLGERRNDLAAAAIAMVPEIETVLRALTSCDGALITRMSGSGATCYALFAAASAAQAAATRLAAAHPRWWVAAGRLLT